MKQTGFRDGVLTLAGVAVLLALLRMSADIVAPFLLALFIAIIAASPVEWLKLRGVPSRWAVVIVVAVVVVLLVLIALMLGNTAAQFNQALPEYQMRVGELESELSLWLAGKGVDSAGILNALDPSAVMQFANRLVLGIGDALSNALLITFTVLFMLVEASGFPKKVAAMDSRGDGAGLQRIADIVQAVNRYASAKAVVSLVTGILIWIGLELAGLDFAPLWGFIAFLLNFVPNIGSILAAVPAVLLAMLQLDPTMVLVVIGIYLVVNTLIGNVFEPMVMGKQVGLSVLAVFLSLVFWGWMFGPVGMLLSVPLSMVVKFAAESNPQTRWLAILLGPVPAADSQDASATEPKKKS